MLFAPQHPVPVFPLPGFVMFPGACVPLHVFELRYRTMVRDALSRGRLITLALLKPGWEADYEGSPEFYGVGCLVRFEEVTWLLNDCYDLKVKGLSRVQIGRVTKEFPYRAARVELMPEAPYPEDDPLTQMEKEAVAETFRRWIATVAGGGEQGEQTEPPVLPDTYAALVNTLCMAAEASAEEKLDLLMMDSVLERGRRVRTLTEERLRVRRGPQGR